MKREKHTVSTKSYTQSQPQQRSMHLPASLAKKHHLSQYSATSTHISSDQQYESFNSQQIIKRQLEDSWEHEIYQDSLEKYEVRNSKCSLQHKLTTLSTIFSLLKRLKDLERDKPLKKEISQIQNKLLDLQRDFLND